jgi:ribosomal protein L14
MSYTRDFKYIVRQGYTRKDGVIVKPIYHIKGFNIIGPLKKGSLTKYGYSSNSSLQERKLALSKAIKAYGSTTVIRKLNAVCVLNKNTNPRVSRIFCADKKRIMNQTR